MKLLSCKVINFGSYKELEFDYSNQGLSLVYGSTGAGKSTLMDIVPWILYGKTAKGGSVEEVKSWQSNGESTTGQLSVRTRSGEITVHRTRGNAKAGNDLFWTEQAGLNFAPHRGKDLVDTQKLLEARLSVDYDTFLSASYFHEFSATGAFFTARAKDRRELFEKLADLELPKKIAEATTASKKSDKSSLQLHERDLAATTGRIDGLASSIAGTAKLQRSWAGERVERIINLQEKSRNFEKDKEEKIKALETQVSEYDRFKLESMTELRQDLAVMEARLEHHEDYDTKIKALKASSRCGECGSLTDVCAEEISQVKLDKLNALNYAKEYRKLKDALVSVDKVGNPYVAHLSEIKALINTYQEQIEAEQTKENPYTEQLDKADSEVQRLKTVETHTENIAYDLKHRIGALEHLYDLSFELRASLLAKAIHNIEAATNSYLEKYFDGEFRAGFSTPDADKLEVSIQKNGHDCVYTQLSKGQRQLLKLAFSVSVMEASANTIGVDFGTLFLDESLDGTDTALKIKAFSLFESLALKHDSVFVIDHSEDLHRLFTKKFHVTLDGDYSAVESE